MFDPSNLSKDYFGLEIGAKLVYDYTEYYVNEEPESSYYVQTVVSTLPENPNVFNVQSNHPEFPEKGSSGWYYLKEADNYYYYDFWRDRSSEKDDVKFDNPYTRLYMINPIYEGFNHYSWGIAKRKEKINVPAGTFEAWYFEYHEVNEHNHTWFVPYLGVVKSEIYVIRDGKETPDYAKVLKAYSFPN